MMRSSGVFLLTTSVVINLLLATFASGQDWTEFWNTFDSSMTKQQKVEEANESTWTKDRCTVLQGAWVSDRTNGNSCYTYSG